MLVDKNYEVEVGRNSKKHYEEIFQKSFQVGDTLVVNTNEIYPKSRQKIEVVCDYCGNICFKQVIDRNNSLKTIEKDCCSKCGHKKISDICFLNYEKINYFQVDDIKDKIKEINLEKYGVEYITQSKEIQSKIKVNNLKKYGDESSSRIDSVKEKAKNTNLKKFGGAPILDAKSKEKARETCLRKYGVDHHTKSEEVKQKIRSTCLEKYGVEHPSKNSDVMSKILKSRFDKNGNTTSKPQNELCEILNGTLNFPCERYVIDIFMEKDNIAIEYDGSGHDLSVRMGKVTQKNFDIKEKLKKKTMFRHGYNILTFKSLKDKNLSKQDTLKIYNFCKNIFDTSNVKNIDVYIDKNYIEYDNNKIEITNII